MGCDMHAYVEIMGEDGKWIDDIAIYVEIDRHYDLFSWLADVRNDVNNIKPIAPAKGLPKDVTDNVKWAAMDFCDDGHSHSWHSLSDLFSSTDLFKYPAFKKQIDKLWQIDPNGRLVFWFDN